MHRQLNSQTGKKPGNPLDAVELLLLLPRSQNGSLVGMGGDEAR